MQGWRGKAQCTCYQLPVEPLFQTCPRLRRLLFKLRGLAEPSPPPPRCAVPGHVVGCHVLQELVNLSAEEMASDEKRQQHAKIRQEVAADLVRGQTQQASTDMFK